MIGQGEATFVFRGWFAREWMRAFEMCPAVGGRWNKKKGKVSKM